MDKLQRARAKALKSMLIISEAHISLIRVELNHLYSELADECTLREKASLGATRVINSQCAHAHCAICSIKSAHESLKNTLGHMKQL